MERRKSDLSGQKKELRIIGWAPVWEREDCHHHHPHPHPHPHPRHTSLPVKESGNWLSLAVRERIVVVEQHNVVRVLRTLHKGGESKERGRKARERERGRRAGGEEGRCSAARWSSGPQMLITVKRITKAKVRKQHRQEDSGEEEKDVVRVLKTLNKREEEARKGRKARGKREKQGMESGKKRTMSLGPSERWKEDETIRWGRTIWKEKGRESKDRKGDSTGEENRGEQWIQGVQNADNSETNKKWEERQREGERGREERPRSGKEIGEEWGAFFFLLPYRDAVCQRVHPQREECITGYWLSLFPVCLHTAIETWREEMQ